MTITATTRVCPACRRILPSDPPHVCAHCATLAVPPLDEWKTDLRVWLAAMAVERKMAPHRKGTPLQRWTALMKSIVAGHQWDGHVLPYACSDADAYAVAVRQVERWIAAGRPDLYE